MANRNFMPVVAAGQNRVILGGSWYPNGTGAITTSDGVTAPAHSGFTVSRTGVGTYTVVLRDKYFAVVDVNFNLILQVTSNQTSRIIGVPRPQATVPNTFIFVAWDPTAGVTGAPFDPPQLLPSAAGTGNLFTFSCIMKNSTIGQAL